jgi:hypothetical protein
VLRSDADNPLKLATFSTEQAWKEDSRSGMHREDASLEMAAVGERTGFNRVCHNSHNSSFDLSAAGVKRPGIQQDDVFHSAPERRRVDRARKRALRGCFLHQESRRHHSSRCSR